MHSFSYSFHMFYHIILFPVICNKIFLIIHSLCNSLHLLTPDSPISLLPWQTSLTSLSESLLCFRNKFNNCCIFMENFYSFEVGMALLFDNTSCLLIFFIYFLGYVINIIFLLTFCLLLYELYEAGCILFMLNVLPYYLIQHIKNLHKYLLNEYILL